MMMSLGGVLCSMACVGVLWGSVCGRKWCLRCGADVARCNGVQWCVAWHFLPAATVAGVVCEGCEQSTFLGPRLGWRFDGAGLGKGNGGLMVGFTHVPRSVRCFTWQLAA